MISKNSFLSDLNERQKFVCISNENFILTACPGSGKTRTITYRLAYLSEKYKESKKINIAITYTNRAAHEIENRVADMEIDTSNIWTGTIHQFCMKFIVRPYSMYHQNLSKGYRVIDEYIKGEYLKSIAEKKGIAIPRNPIDLLKNKHVRDDYKSKLISDKEIDFDVILEYSEELVKDNYFIAENIANIIRSIHVDEFQDTNERQYSILSEIIKANLDINILFVGDVNQAIYRSLGGIAKSFTEIVKQFPVEFMEESLIGCYRSTQRIVDYYTNYEVMSTGVISVAEIKDKQGTITFDEQVKKGDLADKIAGIINTELGRGVPEKEICIVAPSRYQIFPMISKLKKIMPDNYFDAPDLSPIKYDPLNVFFLIAKLFFTRNIGHRLIRRREADEIISMLRNDYGLIIPDGIDKLDVLKAINCVKNIDNDGIKMFHSAVKNVFELFNTKHNRNATLRKSYRNFIDNVILRIKTHRLNYDYQSIEKCFKERHGIVISSIHGIKGEEYTTVIAFDLLEGHLPHRSYLETKELKPFRNVDTNKMLYVLCSRAKENLHLIAERGRVTLDNIPYTTTIELANCNFEYDIEI